jgi:hypothetical protein
MPIRKCVNPRIAPGIALGLFLLLAEGVAGASPVYFIGASSGGQNGRDSLYVINPVTGSPVRIGPITDDHRDMGMEGLAFSSSLGLFGAEDGTLYSINEGTGHATSMGALGVNLTALVDDPANGILYGAAGNRLYTVDTSNGQASLVGSGSQPGGHGKDALAFDSSGDLYETGGGHGPNSLYLIDPATGASTRIGAPGAIGFNEVDGLAFVDGTMYGFTATGLEITINLSDGVGSFFQSVYVGVEASAVDPPGDTPEPAYLVPAGLALAAMLRGRLRHISSG